MSRTDPSVTVAAPSGRRLPPWVCRVVDGVLEASVVGSFSRIGPDVRRRCEGWVDPPSLEGRTAVVTGATSGIGLATAIGLARLGGTVHLVGREPRRLDEAVRAVAEAARGATVSSSLTDLADLDQVRELANAVTARHRHVDVLVHNAGALNRHVSTTPQGVELTAGVQLLAPFLLTGLLLPVLDAGPERARVLTVSSGGLYAERFSMAALEPDPLHYDGVKVYAHVKRAQLLVAHEWAQRLGSGGPAFQVMHPGWVDTPGLASGLPGFRRLVRPLLRQPDDGADTVVWLAASAEGAGSTGGFWLDRHRRGEHRLPTTWLPPRQYAEARAALWAWCVERTGWDLDSAVGDQASGTSGSSGVDREDRPGR
ncbi:MAG: SDR family NAD(P)-dependent oxidoreductase [Acidimicrobiales bacterium]